MARNSGSPATLPPQSADDPGRGRGGRVAPTGRVAGSTQAGALTGNPRVRDCGRYGRVVQFGDSSYVFEKRAPKPARQVAVGLETACIVYIVWLIWVACTMGGAK